LNKRGAKGERGVGGRVNNLPLRRGGGARGDALGYMPY